MAQQQISRKFVLGNKELEGKTAEFQYDHGWYSITDIVGQERNEIYKSRNAQEAYMKWNVYIGRKKERPQREDRRSEGEERRHGQSSGQAFQSEVKGSKKKPCYNKRRRDRKPRGEYKRQNHKGISCEMEGE